jgi:cobalt-zinc-cadmium efflux system membrane fusion protein
MISFMRTTQRSRMLSTGSACVLIMTGLFTAGCKKEEGGETAPPPAKVTTVADMNLITVNAAKAGLFQTKPAEKVEAASQLTATGTVSPDVSRTIPVISLASGRVVDIKVKLDDAVKKGQLLMQVQSPDVTNALATYRKAVNDELLANKAYERAKELKDHGAISQAMVEQAENAENDAKEGLNAAEEQLKLLGVDKSHPSSIVGVYAPTSGVIIAQNVTNAAATGVTYSGSSTAFTIADLSRVWILADVFENDLAKLQLGQTAEIRLNAYPDKTLTGRISDIGPVLDPTLRTAKVRIDVANPGTLKMGMFVTATFAGKKMEEHAVLPSTAILHLHDREWVFLPQGNNQFKRTEIHAGKMLDGGRQEVLSGIAPGAQVVTNALQMETEGNQ